MSTSVGSETILNVTFEELPEEWRNTIERAMQQFKDKCMLSYAKDHEGKIYQKTYLSRMLLDGQPDPNNIAARHAMYETITRAMSTTLANHNDVFLESLTNSLKESLGVGIQSRGPAYSNHNTSLRRSDATVTNVTPSLNGQASGGIPIQQGGASVQQGGNRQHSMQQPMIDYSVCQSAVKIAPGYKRIVRDFNAPPY
jgi:hypothetical protein